MRHRILIAAALALLAAGPAAAAAKKPAPRPAVVAVLPDTPQIAELRRAFHFASPIYEVMKTRAAQLGRARAAGLPNAVNFVLPRLTLADAAARDVTTPNNDTLYGSAWLDLAGGPVVLDIPPAAGRYNSAALMSIETDHDAVLTSPGAGGRFTIAGPGFTGTPAPGTELVRSASADAWLLIRVLVDGPADVDAAANMVLGYSVSAIAGNAPPVPLRAAPAIPDGATFLAVVNQALARSAANPDLAARAARFSAQGIARPASPATAALWTKYLPALRAELRGGLAAAGTTIDGWSYPGNAIGNFGDDDLFRARIALGGLAALPKTEAMYLTATTDKAGARLDGSKAYRVNLPANLPVGAFWSLTMYRQEPDGRLFFVPNNLDRFAVGDRSPQLHANRDGSYEIFVQTSAPQGERVVNWLPAPKGKFTLVFRAYRPRAPLLDGSFRLPAVEVGERIE